jgi:hypothetical protein
MTHRQLVSWLDDEENYVMRIFIFCTLCKMLLPLGRPRRRWENNIKMDLKEVGCGGHGVN